jgi:hypothetical protein
MRNITVDINRYYYIVQLTFGLKDYISKNLIDCKFIATEKKLFIKDTGEEIFPDFILQYNSKLNGILSEIKSSISDENNKLLVVKPQLIKYQKNIKGWDTSNEEVINHDILLIVHTLDSDQLQKELEQAINNKELYLIKNLCLSEFSYQTSPRYDEGDIILLKYKYGNMDCEELKEKLIKNIKILIDQLIIEYDKCKFTRKEPPDEYLMINLWTLIFPSLLKNNNEYFDTNLDTLTEIIQRYFYPWSGIPGESTQVRKNWIIRAMDKFIKIGLAELIHEKPIIYRVLFKKPGLPNDIGEYIIESICKLRLKSLGITKRISKTQKVMTDYRF